MEEQQLDGDKGRSNDGTKHRYLFLSSGILGEVVGDYQVDHFGTHLLLEKNMEHHKLHGERVLFGSSLYPLYAFKRAHFNFI